MHTVTLTVANEQDHQLLLLLTQRLGLTLYETHPHTAESVVGADVNQLSREELLAIVARGGDGLSIPSQWPGSANNDRTGHYLFAREVFA